jgi:hypothetical protein
VEGGRNDDDSSAVGTIDGDHGGAAITDEESEDGDSFSREVKAGGCFRC